MKTIFAYDGGGTKTRLNVMDLEGNILFDRTASGCNIVSSGDTGFHEVISSLFLAAKTELQITDDMIAYVYLGLSGADLESDHERLYKACGPIFGNIRHKLVNDAWIIMRSGLKEPYGAVCIAGTGTNSAAIAKNGNKAILRSLNYTLGTYGGGLDIAREALHYAFRADELTFRDTSLRTEIPKLLNVRDMAEVVPLFYPERKIDKERFGALTALVGKLALAKDKVSVMILKHVASQIALQTAGVIRQLGMEKEKVPVVVGGRVFQIEAQVFRKTFDKTIHAHVRRARIVNPRFTPVVGAYLFALDEMGVAQTPEIEANLCKSGGKL